MNLTTPAQLAERFGLTVDQLDGLRKRNNWPCVKFGRFEVRFTDAQVEQIVALHTEKPARSTGERITLPGQTARSASRKKSA